MKNNDLGVKSLETVKNVNKKYCKVCDSSEEVREFKENYICKECIEIVKKELS